MCVYIYKYSCIQAGLQSNTWKMVIYMEICNLHGNWYPNKQPRGLLFLGYPLEITDANGQFPFSAGISWLVTSHVWYQRRVCRVMTHSYIYQYQNVYHCLSLIVIDYLVAFVEYTGIFVINCYPYHIYSKVSEVSARARCVSLLPSYPEGTFWHRAVATNRAPPGWAQGTIGGNHKGLLDVPLPSLQPGTMARHEISPTLLVISCP